MLRAGLAMAPRLISDVFPEEVCQRIRRTAEFEVLTEFTDRTLAGIDVLLTGWECPPIDELVLAQAPALKAILHAAGTVKFHVGQAVYDRGILVSSAAEANAVPVAEYTVAALIMGAKRLFLHAAQYRQGQPNLSHEPGERSGLYGMTVGIVGASRIGRIVADMLSAYHVKILVNDPYLPESVDLDTLCATADAVTIHAPELPETHHLIDDRRLSLMRPGTLLINTARGSLVDTEALAKHCAAGRIDAILDVTQPEPLPAGHLLLRLPNVLVTPHLAGSRGRELRRLGDFAAAELERFAQGLPLHGLVQAADLARSA